MRGGDKVRAWEAVFELGDDAVALAARRDPEILSRVITYLDESQISRADFQAFYAAESNKNRFFRRCKLVDNIDFLKPFRWFDAFRVDKPKVLILGEGNFTFSAAVSGNLPPVNRSNLLATEYRSYDELAGASNINQADLDDALSYLSSNGVEFRFEIDGTSLPADIGNFDVVLFNFPWVNNPGNSIASTRQVLEGVVAQMNTRLNPGGKLFISQKEFWASPNRLDFASLADGSSLHLVGDKKFSAQEFPNYSHVVTNPDGTTANVTTGVTYIFGKD